MALSEDANHILDVLKDNGIPVGQWIDDRFIPTMALSGANRFAALCELADRGYIRIHEDKEQFALTDLGNQVINAETYSQQNWKPWRPSSDRE
jgi:predicted transcriptional regulator